MPPSLVPSFSALIVDETSYIRLSIWRAVSKVRNHSLKFEFLPSQLFSGEGAKFAEVGYKA